MENIKELFNNNEIHKITGINTDNIMLNNIPKINNIKEINIKNIKNIDNAYKNPEKFEKILFSRNDKELIRKAKKYASVICRGCISDYHINKAFHQFTNGYIYRVDDIIVGFCVWKIVIDNDQSTINKLVEKLYIILLCSGPNKYKFGSQMLLDVEQFARDININILTLETNESVQTFYIKKDFTKFNNSPKKKNTKNTKKNKNSITFIKKLKNNRYKITKKTLKKPKSNYRSI
jgi:hypothetical protein